MANKPIAQTLTPHQDLDRLDEEYNRWMMSGNNNDLRKEWEKIMDALGRQFGNDFATFDAAQKEQSRRPKFKEFVKRLDEYAEQRRELIRLCRLSETAPDSSESWAWMIKDSIAPENGKPGHPFHIPGKIKHFQEGPGMKKSRRTNR